MKSLQRDRYRGLVHSRPVGRRRFCTKIPEVRQTLLVAVDDPKRLDFEAQIFRSEGYMVLQASSAEQILNVAAEHSTIDLFIMDLRISEYAGLELTRRLRVLHPGTPVLMVADSLPVLRVRSDADMEQFALLAKPFQVEQLLQKARRLLKPDLLHLSRKPWCCD